MHVEKSTCKHAQSLTARMLIGLLLRYMFYIHDSYNRIGLAQNEGLSWLVRNVYILPRDEFENTVRPPQYLTGLKRLRRILNAKDDLTAGAFGFTQRLLRYGVDQCQTLRQIVYKIRQSTQTFEIPGWKFCVENYLPHQALMIRRAWKRGQSCVGPHVESPNLSRNLRALLVQGIRMSHNVLLLQLRAAAEGPHIVRDPEHVQTL